MNEYLRGKTKFLGTFSILILVNKQISVVTIFIFNINTTFQCIIPHPYNQTKNKIPSSRLHNIKDQQI